MSQTGLLQGGFCVSPSGTVGPGSWPKDTVAICADRRKRVSLQCLRTANCGLFTLVFPSQWATGALSSTCLQWGELQIACPWQFKSFHFNSVSEVFSPSIPKAKFLTDLGIMFTHGDHLVSGCLQKGSVQQEFGFSLWGLVCMFKIPVTFTPSPPK